MISLSKSSSNFPSANSQRDEPLFVTPELVRSIKRRFPIEGAVLDLMLLDGRAVLISDREVP